jgi:DNA-binding GntR family transcriptional regulator
LTKRSRHPYSQVAAIICTGITEKRNRTAGALQTERELSLTTQLSRLTVRKAIDAPLCEGLMLRL